MSVCLPVPIFLPIYLSILLHKYLSVYVSSYLFIYLSSHLFIILCLYMAYIFLLNCIAPCTSHCHSPLHSWHEHTDPHAPTHSFFPLSRPSLLVITWSLCQNTWSLWMATTWLATPRWCSSFFFLSLFPPLPFPYSLLSSGTRWMATSRGNNHWATKILVIFVAPPASVA